MSSWVDPIVRSRQGHYLVIEQIGEGVLQIRHGVERSGAGQAAGDGSGRGRCTLISQDQIYCWRTRLVIAL